MIQWLRKLWTRSSNPPGFGNPATPIDRVFAELLSNRDSYGPERVLGLPAVFRAVSLISGKIGGLPLQVLRESEDGREIDKAHPAYSFLQNPNPYFSSRTLFQVLIAHALLRGNGYCLLTGFPPTRADILNPDVTSPVITNGQLVYRTKIEDKDRYFGAESVIHIKNLSHEGLVGLSVCDLLRTSLGIACVHETWEKSIYDNGATPATAIEMPGAFKDEDELNLWRKGWKEKMTGPHNAGETAILQLGAKLNRLPLNMEDAQFLQSKEFDIKVIANITGCPSSKLGGIQTTSYSSLEQQEQAFLDDCIESWLQTIEEELSIKLRSEQEKADNSVIIEYQRAALIRTDTRTENDILVQELTNGILTLNQVLKIKNLPLLPPEIGDTHRIPANLTTIEALEDADELAETPEEEAKEVEEVPSVQTDGPQEDAAESRLAKLLLVDVSRLFKRIQKSGGDTEHRAVMIESLSPAIPDIADKLDTFFSELRHDRSLLDYPERFINDYGN